jgi:hypothetical protein
VPILARAGATVPTTTGHVEPDPRFNDTRRLDFRSLSGDVLAWDSPSWIPRTGIEGLHMPPREVVRGQVPGLTGSLLTEIRDVERLVSFPVFVGSDDGHRAHLDQLARLQSFLDFTGVDYAAAGGTFDLVATSASGVRSLRCAYLEGMEGSEGVDSGVWWASFGLRLLAVDPYWHGEAWSTRTLRVPGPLGWLSAANGTYTATWPGGITNSLVIGAGMPVDVTGDAPPWPTIEVAGPATTFRAQTSSGLDVLLVGGLAAGETLRVVTDPRGRDVTFNGVRDWSRVAPGDRWEPMRPGRSTVTLTMADATEASSARLFGESLFKRAW